MNPEPRELDQIQRWMQAVIMHPGGIVEGIESPQAREEIDVGSGDVEQVVGRSCNLTSIERLAVYGNAYYARLLECLREEFPALLYAVGDNAFDALAFAYLQACPSRSYTLATLGARFPEHLARTRPPKEDSNSATDWPKFMIDLATLERTYSEVFDGPGFEGLKLIEAADLTTIPPDQWAEVQLVTVECLRLVAFDFPVHEYASAVKRNEKPEIPDPRATFLAISRRDYIVRRWELDPLEFQLMELLQHRATVGDAIGTVVAGSGGNEQLPDDFEDQLRRWFEKWTAAGFFESVVEQK